MRYIQFIELMHLIKNSPSESLESEILEFKNYESEKSLFNSKDLENEISALANHKGGTIIIGIIDSSEIKSNAWYNQLVGAPKLDLSTAKERIKGRLQPKIELELFEYEFETKIYVLINIPFSANSLVGTSKGKYYVRDGKSSIPMSPEEVKNKVEHLHIYDWSNETLSASSISELNSTSLAESKKYYLEKKNIKNITDADYLEAIGVTGNGKLTKGGLLLLGEKESIKKQLGVFEYRFSWKEKNGNLLINEVWDENIWESIKKANELFSQINEFKEIVFEENKYSIPNLDKIAFHEALLNAIVHRNYAIDGMITLEYKGKDFTITSPGSFYGGITAANIAFHEPRHRNKNLARILMLFDQVDRAGMGVLRMGIHSLKYGREFPKFTEVENSVSVKMRADYLIPIIFALTYRYPELGLIDLVILNQIQSKGSIAIAELAKLVAKISRDPYQEIVNSVENTSLSNYVTLSGRNDGIFIVLRKDYRSIFNVKSIFRESPSSERHVTLFKHLLEFNELRNEEISKILNIKYSSQTAQFLRKASYVKRKGKSTNSKWSLLI